jgi:hypothetical protein
MGLIIDVASLLVLIALDPTLPYLLGNQALALWAKAFPRKPKDRLQLRICNLPPDLDTDTLRRVFQSLAAHGLQVTPSTEADLLKAVKSFACGIDDTHWVATVQALEVQQTDYHSKESGSFQLLNRQITFDTELRGLTPLYCSPNWMVE